MDKRYLKLLQEIFELSYDGNRFSAEEVIRHETGPKVVMNSACFSDKKNTFLVAGQESHCQLYRIGITVEKEVSEESGIDLLLTLTDISLKLPILKQVKF